LLLQKSGSGILPLQTLRLEAASTLAFLTTARSRPQRSSSAGRIWIPAPGLSYAGVTFFRGNDIHRGGTLDGERGWSQTTQFLDEIDDACRRIGSSQGPTVVFHSPKLVRVFEEVANACSKGRTV
jgi:hypothetical protein